MLQKGISSCPRSEDINYFFQSKLTKSLPWPKQQFMWRVEHAVNHFKKIQQRNSDIGTLRGYEFGAGWDLIIPLAYYCFGINDQTVIDIRPNLRMELVNDAIRRLIEYAGEIEALLGRTIRALESEPIRSHRDLERFGIKYLAPCDARSTSLPYAHFDFITSTYTLEHIPKEDIILIMRECARILKPGGIVSSLVDMQDHYALFDVDLSVYNYLRFPAWKWALVNSDIHYQNRLRYSDYLKIVQDEGFCVLDEWVDRPTEDNLRELRAQRLAPEFLGYAEHDLAAKRLGLVMNKFNPEEA
jgi:SAM-dependent methyltransferase